MLPILSAVAISCKKKPTSDEVIHQFSSALCYKMADCSAEQFKNFSESERKMAMKFAPTREKCDKEIIESATNQAQKDNKIELTSEEIELAHKCIAEIEATPCGQMEQSIPACEQFTSVVEQRSGIIAPPSESDPAQEQIPEPEGH